MELEDLSTLVARAGDEDPLEALAALGRMRAEVDRVEELQVRRARVRGASWALIAHSLGVTRQAVHQKYRGRPGLGWRRC